MYDKPVMACFEYQAYLYGSEAVTYLNALLRMVKRTISRLPHPYYRQPYPTHICMAA